LVCEVFAKTMHFELPNVLQQRLFPTKDEW
jgi:hypothetical protein